MFEFLHDYFFGGDTQHLDDVSVLAIKKKAAKSLQDSAPLKDISGNIDSYDTDGNGWITASDCPYIHGTAQAKLWHQHVLVPAMKLTKSLPEAIPYQQQFGGKFAGFYNGKAVILGNHSSQYGNNEYIQDRLELVQGLSKAAAQNVSQFISNNLILKE